MSLPSVYSTVKGSSEVSYSIYLLLLHLLCYILFRWIPKSSRRIAIFLGAKSNLRLRRWTWWYSDMFKLNSSQRQVLCQRCLPYIEWKEQCYNILIIQNLNQNCRRAESILFWTKTNIYFEDPLIIAVLGYFHYIVWVCPALYSIP